LLIAAAVSIVALAVGYVLMVRTSIGQRFDHAAALGALQQNPSQAAADRNSLQRITGDSFAVVLAVIVAIGALRRRLLLGICAAVAAASAVLLTDFLKDVVLTRPYLTLQVPPAVNTFPSGHTATAVASAMALVLVCPPRWKGVAAVFAGTYGWLTAAEVQTAGWHRPSDAMGGALVAFATVCTGAGLLARYRPVSRRPTGHHRPAHIAMGLVGTLMAALSAIGLVVVLEYLHAHTLYGAAASHTRNTAYTTGVALTVAVVIALLMVLLALLGRVDLDSRGS
jgi:membrane-associated phospholipid phosphatase